MDVKVVALDENMSLRGCPSSSYPAERSYEATALTSGPAAKEEASYSSCSGSQRHYTISKGFEADELEQKRHQIHKFFHARKLF